MTGLGLSYLEKAGKIITDVYKSNQIDLANKDYNLLIAGMALYSAKQYSRAFIVMKNVSVDFDVGQIVASFISKNFYLLTSTANRMFFAAQPEEREILPTDIYILEHEIARCFMLISDYIFSGDKSNFIQVESILSALLAIATEDKLSFYWIIIRLLKIMFKSFQQNSLWERLPPYYPKSGVVSEYIRLLSSLKLPVIELWDSQVSTLDTVLGNNKGAVVNLRTSGGKTRVAELAILKSLTDNPLSKILYLAPFRSLALELEQSLSRIFAHLGFTVTHLYGGATVSLSDFELIEDANIIIATPEKAKALIRGGIGLEAILSLIIVDEGHLLGVDKRLIRNEIFLTHLNNYVMKNNTRIVLLSAVLPNADDLAEWLTTDRGAVVKSDLKPSLERRGILLWNGNNVRLQWLSDEKPFNPNFVEKKPLGFSGRRNGFPNNKKEAIAATAVRLANTGTVMIFSARANSIEGLADSVLLAMGESPLDFDWNKNMWEIFEKICMEELGADDIVLRSARKGVVCHSNRLPTLVRNAIERLMRSKSPFIIIASTTLGQGVNIGISSVIVATPYMNKEIISCRDFWNVCGRAGRAYSDIEGKILYAYDRSNKQKPYQMDKNAKIAARYFKGVFEPVKSGLLGALRLILEAAQKAGVSFELLLEAISNDFYDSTFVDEEVKRLKDIFDFFDDELLAMHDDFTDIFDSIDWAEKVFKDSLALIQAQENEKQQLIEVLKSRVNLLKKITPQKAERQAIISTGVPFTVSVALLRDIEFFKSIAIKAIEIDNIFSHIGNSLPVIKGIEEWVIKNANSLVEKTIVDSLAQPRMDTMREKWILGIDLAVIDKEFNNVGDIVKDFYGFTLPWVVHAIARLFDPQIYEEIHKFYSQLALFIELGLPTETAANIYLSGVHSRHAAIELAELDSLKAVPLKHMKHALINLTDGKGNISKTSKVWLDGMVSQFKAEEHKAVSLQPFSLTDDDAPDKLFVRCIYDDVYLLSSDGYYQKRVTGEYALKLKKIADCLDLFFEKNGGMYLLRTYNPQVTIL
jgi:replicative superfamily II helicase